MNAFAHERLASHSAHQEELLPFLLNPNSYPHRPKTVRLVQTHSSFVFIASPFVYKIKKAVDFGFLNFSTLEKRHYFCEREVELNRRLCPGIYLGNVPIFAKDGSFTFTEGEHVVEYAVKMRKLSERHFLDRLLHADAVVPGDIDRIALTLKAFYGSQHPTDEIEAWGKIDRLRISTDENFRQTEQFVDHTLSRAAFEAIRCYTNTFYGSHRRLFESRIKEQWIRDCHGDLHVEHIHITPHALHIYDCIEFNDRFRYIDVCNDAAFLAMDLDYEGRPDLAHRFVIKLAAVLNDTGMSALMDFYKCYRAYVRGKVESLHSIDQVAPEPERVASAERARRYFRLALHYAVAGSQPLVLATTGRIASGKSTLARALGTELECQVISSDRLRKEMAGFPLFERRSEVARSQLYSEAMTQKTYEKIFALAEEEIRNHRTVVLDATFARAAQRHQLIQRFGRPGAQLRLIEAQANDKTIKNRLKAREARADEISDARLEDYAKLNSIYQPPLEVPPHYYVAVSTTEPEPLLHALTHLACMHGSIPTIGSTSNCGCSSGLEVEASAMDTKTDTN